MSDKFKEMTPVAVTFVQGESPTPAKMENAFAQVETAMNNIERAIGDIWNQNQTLGEELDNNPNYIANLSRSVGNMSTLNPKSLGGNTLNIVGEAVPTGKRVFALAYAPDDPATPASITFTNPTGVFDTLVGSIAAVNSAGDYFIDTSGLVYTFTVTASHAVSYDHTTISDSYSGASYNVIPNTNQAVRLTVVETVVDTEYDVTLPVDTDAGSKNYNQQLTLPSILSTLADGEEIPAGFLYLWDNTTNTMVEGLTFAKKAGTLSSFTVFGSITPSSQVSNKYSAITVGTQISTLISSLRDYIYSHAHNDNKSSFIEHATLLGSDDPVAHGVTSSIMGVDDVQYITNKTFESLIVADEGTPVTDIIVRGFNGQIQFKNVADTQFQTLVLPSIPEYLTGKQAEFLTDTEDGTTGIHASSLPNINEILALDSSAKFPNSVLYTGHGNGIDADTLDSKHAPAGTIVGTTDTQTLTNKRLDLPKLNSATTTNITSEELENLTNGTDADSLHSHPTLNSAFGTWSSGLGNGTIYQAATDGIVVAWSFASAGQGGNYTDGYTDSSASPTTKVQEDRHTSTYGSSNACFPVKKNDYWKVVIGGGTVNIFWMPLG